MSKKKKKKIIKKTTTLAINDFSPILKNGKKLALASKMSFSKAQVLALFARTPREYIYTRPAKGGGTWEYAPGAYFRKVLNYIFGFNWNFKILDIEEKYGQISVTGRLTVKDEHGNEVYKEQAGRADIKLKKDTKIPMDYGNDKKAAITDCFKKCASEFGIASDIYSKNEYKDVGVEFRDEEVPAKPDIVQTAPKTAEKIVVDTGLDTDYTAKLKEQVKKMAKKPKMNNQEIIDFINQKLDTKISSIKSKAAAQILLAQLSSKK